MNTVFIPTAGIGSRLGELTKHQNKSLVNYKQKPVISHILDKFDHKTTSFVIALGHKGNFVKQATKFALAFSPWENISNCPQTGQDVFLLY